LTLLAKLAHAEGIIGLFNREGISWLSVESVLVEGTKASSLLQEEATGVEGLKQQLHFARFTDEKIQHRILVQAGGRTRHKMTS
jgi:hypothetical protein